MSICALPTLVEKNVADYLTANYSGGYTINKGFSVSDLILPALIIKAGKFIELEPGSHVFNGDLEVAVITQIDETTDPIAAHDQTVSTVYTLLFASELGATFNLAENGHLWGYYLESFDQERVERSLVSSFTVKVAVQSLAI